MACIQETKLTSSCKTPSFPGYAVIRRDRPTGGGGGLITLIHHAIPFVEVPSPFNNNNNTEAILVNVTISGENLVVANLYIPPQSSCPPNSAASLLPLLNDDYVIVGDVNGHNDLWSMGTADARGDAFAEEIDEKNFVILNNPDISTRPSSSSSPDIVAVPPNLALSLT